MVWQRQQALEVIKKMQGDLSMAQRVLDQVIPGYRPAPSAIRRELERLTRYLERAKVKVGAVPVTQLEKQQHRSEKGRQ